MKDVSKNDVLKTFKAMLHYGTKIYNFNQVLALMQKFKFPGETKKEQDFYVYKEFEKFLTGEDEPRYIILWKTLYYYGLRIGEARGLQWKDIDWKKKTIWFNKQVQSIITILHLIIFVILKHLKVIGKYLCVMIYMIA